MRETIDKKIYCSLDIETSDFEVGIGEIMELGMVFFEIENQGGIKILSEWQSTFKCNKPVPARILALTGITTEELEISPAFSEKIEEIQSLLERAVIVGHNINFDITFLQNYGIKFSGKSVDTLGLAQVFLPTAHSYNLEAIMAFLEVEHKEAHRAIADSRAVVVVFEKLLKHYASFPENLKSELKEIFNFNNSEIYALLQTEFEPKSLVERPAKVQISGSAEINEALKKSRQIICFPLGFDYHTYIYGAIKKSREKMIVVLPNKKILYELWRQNMVYPFFDNQDVFSADDFEKNINVALTPEQRLFFAKILVWKGINWQSQSLIDLNFSFFGNQFRQMVSFGRYTSLMWPLDETKKIIAMDYYSFINSAFSKSLAQRKLVILDINNFESALGLFSSKRVSWHDFIYAVKQFEPKAERILSQVDLFFGLATLNLRKINPISANVLINEQIRQTREYALIKVAASNFVSRIRQFNQDFNSERLNKYLENLESFFDEQQGRIKYIEIYENRLTFFNSPEDLSEIANSKLGIFSKIIFTASLGSEALINYFVRRLDLHDFSINAIGQQELSKKIEIIIPRQQYSQEQILDLIQNLEFPAAFLLPSAGAVKEFYERNFRQLQKKYKVFAQGFSGGTNKLLGNFSINKNSLFIGTDKLILKQIGRRLSIKSLVLSRLPFEQYTHPLFAVQAAKYQNQFAEFNIPRALYNFHSIIKFFHTPELERVYILDQKIHRDYGKYFMDYLKSLPFVEIKEQP